MASLLIDKSLQQLEQILLDAISIGMKQRKASVASIAALRALPTVGVSGTPIWKPDDYVFCVSSNNVFRWVQSSLSADDSINIIRPNDLLASATGRWAKVITSVLIAGVNAARVAQPPVAVENVILHNGDFSWDVLQARIYGRAPCVAIHFTGGKHRAISQIPGALYDYRVSFDIWSVSRNFRDRFEAALGSTVDSDPGALSIHGALKKLVAGKSGQDQQAELSSTGVKWLEIKDEEIIESSEAERVFVMSLGTEIYASLDNPEAPGELAALSEIDVQYKLSDAPAPRQFDLKNCIVGGLTVPQQIGFFGIIAAGSVVLNQQPISVAASSHTFATDQDIYRDLTSSGTWVFTAVPHGAPEPNLVAGRLRVAVTVTDAVGVVLDKYLTSVYEDYPAANSPDVIPV